MTTAIIAISAILCVAASAYLIIQAQQRLIEKLTNRLMVANGHREYIERPIVEEEIEYRKPMSFYDDPSVPLDNRRRSYPNNAEEIDDDDIS